MTLEEAKEILKKEGWTDFKKLAYRPTNIIAQPEWEKPTVVEALEVCYDNHVLPLILKEKLSERLGRLKAEYEKSHGDGQVDCQDCKPTKGEHDAESGVGMSLQEAIEMLLDKGYVLIKVTDEHPSQAGLFDGALKCAVATVNANGYMVCYNNSFKIANKEYVDAVKKLKVVAKKKNKKIASLKKSIKEKDEVIDTISEELRLSKVREEELIATVKDYLALVGDKDEEIKKLKKKLESNEKARNEYCDYGVGANNFIKKICLAYVNAHERGVYSLEALFAGRKYRYDGIPLKDAFEYAKEEKHYNKKNVFTGVDVGSDEGDKVYVGAFAIYNEVPICKDPLTVDELIEIQKKIFRKAPF